MTSATPQGAKLLYGLQKGTRFDKGLGLKLPAAYRKFYNEWKVAKPASVHYIPKEGQWERDEVTGQVRTVQNVPIPVIYPPEHNDGIWGGEGVVKGYQKRHPQKRRVPHYWVPVLRRSVLYSQVLDKYMSITVTDRTMDLIHDNHGFDHYLLKTPACDLKSTLALTIKRKILQSLQSGCPELQNDPKKQSLVLNEFKQYADQYTAEEIDWYGLSYFEAIMKIRKILQATEPIVPHKVEFRSKLVEQLREAGVLEAQQNIDGDSVDHKALPTPSSWLSKINPFSKKQET